MTYNKATSLTEKIGVGLVCCLVSLSVLFFLMQSVFLTVADLKCIDDGYSKGLVYPDSPWLHLLVFVCMLLLAVLLARFRPSTNALRAGAVAISLIVLLGLLYFVIDLNLFPEYDRLAVYKSANAYLQGDYSWLAADNYIGVYQNQKGLLTADMLAIHLFGYEQAYLVLELLNALFFVASGWVLAILAKRMTGADSIFPFVYITAPFLPLGLYTSFVYGTLAGLFFALLELLFLDLYRETHRALWGILLAACGAIAIFLKENFWIFAVAAIIYLLWDAIKVRRLRSLVPLALLLTLTFINGQLLTFGLYTRVGIEQPAGLPTVTWISMGMQQTASTDGWYNSYGEDYYRRCLDDGPEVVHELAKADLSQAMSHYAQAPAELFRFLCSKNATQWNMPTAQSVSINRHRNQSLSSNPVLVSLLQVGGTGYKLYMGLFNLLLTQIWCGVLLYFFLNRKQLSLRHLLPAVVYLGGFLFHTVWEAKAQYTVVYLFLMLPYALLGFAMAGRQLQAFLAKPRPRSIHPSKASCAAVAVLAAVLLLPGITGNYLSTTRPQAQADLLSYRQILADGSTSLPTAPGYFACADGKQLYVDPYQEGARAVLTEAPGTVIHVERSSILILSRSENVSHLVVYDSGEPIALGVNAFDGVTFLGKRGTPADAEWTQRWFTQEVQPGQYCIRLIDAEEDFTKALTANLETGEVTLQDYTGAENQLWSFIPQ